MASNPTPENADVLRALGDLIADGCHTHEATIGILQNTEATIRAAITTLSNAETTAGFKKTELANAFAALDAADVAGTTCINNCKLRLRQVLGERWNAGWEPTGFPDQSTGVPNTQDKRFTLLDALKNYFTAVPASENAGMGATAALCEAAWAALSNARQTVSACESAQTTAFDARAAATDSLRKRVRGLINELDTLIAVDDPRWEAFGLNIPANPSAPDPVGSVSAAPMGNGRVEVSYLYATRATRYKIETFITGVDTEWQSKASAKDLEVILKGFTAGQSVKVRVIATNDGGDASPSPEATVVVT
ncbi:MAG: fibronectin type III domain-containing protein [Verrucomicrobiaceae bacterium]|nr:fibronectin type III domain-containing protein [Verrucomicrobiaceae bacterium]